jgi:hypothetical protein
VYFWGAQLEAASFASSYIPTTTAAVARNADMLTYPFAGNASATEGTCYAECAMHQGSPIGGTTSYFVTTGIDAQLGIGAGSAATTIICRDGTNVVTKTGLTSLDGTVRKRASSWGAAGQAITGDGAAPQTGAFDGAITDTGIGIGSTPTGSNWAFGTIKNVRIFQRQFSDAALAAMTA